MLRALFCISCCSAPPSNRGSKQRKLSSSPSAPATKQQEPSIDKENNEITTKNEVLNEKDQLLENQINSNNDNYGSKSGQEPQSQGKISPHTLSGKDIPTITTVDTESPLIDDNDQSRKSEEDSITAQTSSRQTLLQRQEALDHNPAADLANVRLDGQQTTSSKRVDLPSTQALGDSSPPSSIDVDEFTESATSGNVTKPPRDESFEQQGQSAQEHQLKQQQRDLPGVNTRPVSGQGAGETVGQIEAATQASTARNVPSTTKIGDYARIEYSPVEDLESVTTVSYSRFGSEKGARSQAGSTLSRQNSMKAKSTDGSEAARSRRSSQGIESTSISIASQLSNEQLQQNLTNMLESANSPNPMYGTIGLPLGPPLESSMTAETGKTSPETTGAALTSASQDSLSDTSLGDMGNNHRPPSEPATLRSNVSVGAALVGDSMEDSAELSISAPLATGESDPPPRSQPTSIDQVKPAVERVGSPASMATTTSGGITAPTPTPSELSTSSTKKKRLKAKALFKRFKGGSKKNKSKDDGDENK